MKKINQPKNSIKYIFKNNIWITGYYLNKEIIGRTCIFNNMEMVMCINENSKPQLINFDDVSNLSKLNILAEKITNPNNKNNKINQPNLLNFHSLLNLVENSKN